MQISIVIDPAQDNVEQVRSVVDALFGRSFPKLQADQTALSSHVSLAPTLAGVSTQDANATASQSQPVATVAHDLPNGTTAPTVVVPAGPVTASPAGVALDKNGIPWDVRIHSGGTNPDGSHKQTAAGVWAKKKGVNDLTVSTITKELQNLMAAQVGHVAPPAGLPAGGVLGNPVNVPHHEAIPLPNDPNAYVVQPVATAQPTTTAAPTTVSAPVIAPSALAPMPLPVAEPVALAPQIAPMPVPPPQPAAAPTTFADLAVWLAPNLEGAGGKLSNAHVEHFCRQCGIVNAQGQGEFALVANRPDAVAWLHQAFTAQIAAAQV